MSCSFGSANNVCGPTTYAPDCTDIIPLQSYRKDLSNYLTNLGVSGSRGYGTQNVPFEYDLILNWAGLLNLSNKEKENMTVRVSKTQVWADDPFPEVFLSVLLSYSQKSSE